MNKYLLTTLITGALGGTVAGFNAGGVKETDLDKRVVEVVGRELSPKRHAEGVNAQEKDSVTLTVKWIQKKEASEKDTNPEFYIIVDDKGGCVAIAKNDLVKNKNNTYSMKLPKGVYQTVFEFHTDTPEAAGIGKYIFKENVSLVSDTTLTYDGNEANEDRTTPTVQMMQMRDRNGKITNKFDKENDGEIRLAYGDFYFDRGKGVYKVLPCDLKLEVSPYGKGKFTEMKATEESGMFRMPVWGYFSRAKIGKLERTGNGWWDLRISLKDKAGNTQVQTVSPAFYAGYSDPAGVGSAIADSQATVTGIYDITGMRHNEYVNGINIVKYSDGTTKKIMVRK